jgi:transposase-like protein
VGDGALGFWAAMNKEFPATRQQRCWVHKTVNVLNKLPKSLQPKARAHLHDIWLSATREEAFKALEKFVTTCQAKHPGAVQCLLKDKEQLLAFYDFPAEHWQHLRTTNPIESTFATVQLRSYKTKGPGSGDTGLAMVFKLARQAEKRWRRISGPALLADLIAGAKFTDGVKQAA